MLYWPRVDKNKEIEKKISTDNEHEHTALFFSFSPLPESESYFTVSLSHRNSRHVI